MKDENEVIKEFNELVNMTASDLEKWLKSDDSRSAGWPKEGGDGESIGHDSGVKIVDILKSNPKKDPKKYTDEQVQHMRKVVSYCKRHLAQEERANDEKPASEVKKTKSYASLMNWGHDVLKKRGEGGADVEDDEEDEPEEDEVDEKQTGEKRKGAQKNSGSNKKRETRQTRAQANGDEDKQDEGEDEDEEAYEEVEEDVDDDGDEEGDDAENKTGKDKKANGKKSNGNSKSQGKQKTADEDGDNTANKGPNKGDTVSWNWGQGHPKGKVLDVKGEKTAIETKRGNEVTRNGNPEDPAVVLDTGKSKAIKSNHELN